MPRKPSKPRITVIYEAIPVPVPSPPECGGMLCLNMECRSCWGDLDDLDIIFDPTPGVTVDVDEATYSALLDEARRQSTTVATVAKRLLQEWAERKGQSPPCRKPTIPGRIAATT